MATLKQRWNRLRGQKYGIAVFLTTFIVLNIIFGVIVYMRYTTEAIEEIKRIENEKYDQ